MPALYLVRHGEPELSGVLLGRRDPELSERGRRQMQEAPQIEGNVIYTSRLRRSRQSAEVMAAGRPLIVLSDLDEISLGAWDGMTWQQIESEYPELARRKLEDWTGVTPPGGEAWTAFTSRVDQALEAIRRGPLPAIVVAHLTVNSWIAHRLAGADPIGFKQDYGQVYRYEL